MRAGKLRRKIEIQQAVETQDSAGEPVTTWEKFHECRARVHPLQGREFFDSAQHYGEVTHRVEIRYVAGVTAKMRVLYNGRVLDIKAPLNLDERNRELHLMCTEPTN